MKSIVSLRVLGYVDLGVFLGVQEMPFWRVRRHEVLQGIQAIIILHLIYILSHVRHLTSNGVSPELLKMV